MYNEGVKQKNNLFIIWQHIIGICILVLTVLFSWLFLAEKTSDRLQDQMAQARNIALSHSSITTIETESSKEAASVVKEKSQDAIDRVTFGRFKGKPIWEVKAGSSYYVVDFKTGKVTGVF